MAPIRTGNVEPPIVMVTQIDLMDRLAENDGGGNEQFRLGAGIFQRVRRTLGERHIVRGLHEAGELFIGDRVAVDPEAVNADVMRRSFFGIVAVRAHRERAVRDPGHVGEVGAIGGFFDVFRCDPPGTGWGR